MSALSSLISDVDQVIERGSGRSRTRTLSRITDLLTREDGSLQDEQVDIFDNVIARFTPSVEVQARVTLAERIAGLRNGPPGVVRILAFDDEIAVARPVLARSRQLDDQDLMAVATEKGSRHMLAICERPQIAENVTDILVTLGDTAVKHAVAVHGGAKLSEHGTASLIEDSIEDETLQISLGERRDLSSTASRRLIEVTRESTRRQIMATLSPPDSGADEPKDDGAEPEPVPPAGGRDYRSATAALRRILSKRPLAESDVSDFAQSSHEPEAILTLASLVGVPVGAAERVYDDRASDLLLLVCKTQNWSWKTLRSLLHLRDPSLAASRQLGGAETRFGAMTPAKARRTLQMLTMRAALGEPRNPASLIPS